MDNKNKEIPCFEDLYKQHLSVINTVKLTRREIDIIAFFVCGRSPKKIALFFSISPKTVENHTHNIRLKLGCSSKDNIIDFIEKANVLGILRKHYINIIVHAEYVNCLKEISKIITKSPPIVLIAQNLVEQEKLHFIETSLETMQIPFERRHANSLKAFQELIKNKYVIYFKTSEENEISKMCGENGSLFLLSPSQKEPLNLSQENQTSLYLAFFKILKEIFQNENMDTSFNKFKEQCKNIETNQPILSQSSPEKIASVSKMSYGNIVACGVFLVLTVISLSIYSLFWYGKLNPDLSGKNQIFSIRSDLEVPIDSVRLDRPELIAQINDRFNGWSGIQTVALVGIGGAGKTTLARQYASSQKINHVWEINAESKETLQESFEDLAKVLAKSEEDKRLFMGIDEMRNAQEKEERLVEFVKEKLRELTGWFLIYDNVDKFVDIQNYFPKDSSKWGQGRVILTTRNKNIESNKHVGNIIHLHELTAQQKIDLFLKIMYNGNRETLTADKKQEVESFIAEIPAFPLDVSVAAYYIKATHIPFHKYLENMTHFADEVSDMQENILLEAGNYKKTRYSIITLSLKDLLEEDEGFRDLLLFISLIDPINIPRELLTAYKDDMIVDKFLYHLNMYSLISNNTAQTTNQEVVFSIHRSIQAIIREYLINTLQLGKNKEVMKTISDTMQTSMREAIDKEDFAKMKLLSKHAEQLLKHKDILRAEDIGRVGAELGCIYHYLCFYSKSMTLLEDVIKIFKKHPHSHEPELTQCYLYLGNVYRKLGNLTKAKDLYEQCLNTSDKSPSQSLKTARAYGSLGIIYEKWGDFKMAKDLLEKGLSIYKTSSDNTVGLAWSLTQLGRLYSELGEYEKAKEIFEQSLTIYKTYSENYVGVAWVYGNLGKVYLKLKDYQKAKDLITESLNIYKKHFFDNHFYVARASVNLGNYYKEMEDTEKAKALLKKALVDIEGYYGSDHIETGTVLKYLGQVYLAEGNLEVAETMLKKALEVYEKDKSLYKFQILESLGELYHKQSLLSHSQHKYQEALNSLKGAIEIVQNHFPENSPHLTRIQANLKLVETDKEKQDKKISLSF